MYKLDRLLNSKKFKISAFTVVFGIALIRLISSFSSPVTGSLNGNFNLQNFNGNIPIHTLSQAVDPSKDIEVLRKNFINSLGIEFDYRLTKSIFWGDTKECVWQSRDSYYTEGLPSQSSDIQLDSDIWVNPLLLIFPRFSSVASIKKQASALSAAPHIDQFLYNNQNRTFELFLNLSSVLKSAVPDQEGLSFYLNGMNAFDLGYTFLRLNSDKSTNIKSFMGESNNKFTTNVVYGCLKNYETPEQSFNRKFISGVAGDIVLSALPAKMQIDLLRGNSENPESIDASFVINFH